MLHLPRLAAIKAPGQKVFRGTIPVDRMRSLVVFEGGYFKHNERTHSIDWDRPAEHLLARSLDGGETWKVEHPLSLRAPDGTKQANVPSEPGGKAATDCPGGINFTNPN